MQGKPSDSLWSQRNPARTAGSSQGNVEVMGVPYIWHCLKAETPEVVLPGHAAFTW